MMTDSNSSQECRVLRSQLAAMELKLSQQARTQQELNILLNRMHIDIGKAAVDKESFELTIEGLRQNIEALKSTISEMDLEKDEVKKRENDAKMAIVESEEKLNAMRADRKKLAQRIDRLEADKQELVLDFSSRAKEYDVARRRNEELEVQLKELKAALEDERSRTEGISEGLVAMQDEFERLRNECLEQQQAIAVLSKQRDEAEQMREQLVADRREQQTESAKRLTDYSEQNKKMAAELSLQSKEIERLRADVETATNSQQILLKERDESRSQFNIARGRIQSLEDLVEEISTRLEASRAEVDELKASLVKERKSSEGALARMMQVKELESTESAKRQEQYMQDRITDAVRNALQDVELKFSQEREGLSGQLREKKKEVTTLRAALDSAESALAEAKRDLATEMERRKVLSKDMKTTKIDLSSQVEEYQAKLRSLEVQCETERGRVKDANAQLRDAQTDLELANEQKQRMNSLLAEKDLLLSREREARLEALQKLRSLDDDLQTAHSQRDVAVEEASMFRKQLKELDRKLVVVTEAKDQEIERLTRRNQVLTESIAQLASSSSSSSTLQQQQYHQYSDKHTDASSKTMTVASPGRSRNNYAGSVVGSSSGGLEEGVAAAAAAGIVGGMTAGNNVASPDGWVRAFFGDVGRRVDTASDFQVIGGGGSGGSSVGMLDGDIEGAASGRTTASEGESRKILRSPGSPTAGRENSYISNSPSKSNAADVRRRSVGFAENDEYYDHAPPVVSGEVVRASLLERLRSKSAPSDAMPGIRGSSNSPLRPHNGSQSLDYGDDDGDNRRGGVRDDEKRDDDDWERRLSNMAPSVRLFFESASNREHSPGKQVSGSSSGDNVDMKMRVFTAPSAQKNSLSEMLRSRNTSYDGVSGSMTGSGALSAWVVESTGDRDDENIVDGASSTSTASDIYGRSMDMVGAALRARAAKRIDSASATAANTTAGHSHTNRPNSRANNNYPAIGIHSAGDYGDNRGGILAGGVVDAEGFAHQIYGDVGAAAEVEQTGDDGNSSGGGTSQLERDMLKVQDALNKRREQRSAQRVGTAGSPTGRQRQQAIAGGEQHFADDRPLSRGLQNSAVTTITAPPSLSGPMLGSPSALARRQHQSGPNQYDGDGIGLVGDDLVVPFNAPKSPNNKTGIKSPPSSSLSRSPSSLHVRQSPTKQPTMNINSPEVRRSISSSVVAAANAAAAALADLGVSAHNPTTSFSPSREEDPNFVRGSVLRSSEFSPTASRSSSNIRQSLGSPTGNVNSPLGNRKGRESPSKISGEHSSNLEGLQPPSVGDDSRMHSIAVGAGDHSQAAATLAAPSAVEKGIDLEVMGLKSPSGRAAGGGKKKSKQKSGAVTNKSNTNTAANVSSTNTKTATVGATESHHHHHQQQQHENDDSHHSRPTSGNSGSSSFAQKVRETIEKGKDVGLPYSPVPRKSGSTSSNRLR